MVNQGVMKDPRMMGPLGNYGIAQSLVQTPGWKALEAEQNEMLPDGGGGGFGGRVTLGPAGRPMNDMERTIDAHNYPGGFKVATDQYAAKNSEQLDAWALAEMKYKFPNGPKNGGTWEQEFARQKWFKENANGRLWDKDGFRPVNTLPKVVTPTPSVSRPTLSGVADRDRDGLVKKNKPAFAPLAKKTYSANRSSAIRGGRGGRGNVGARRRAASTSRASSGAQKYFRGF
jgi:hypothetical protein